MGAYSNRTFCPLGCYENPSVKVMQSLLTAMRLFCSLPLSVSSLLLRLSDLPNFRIFFHISSFPCKLNTTEPTVSHASITEMVLEKVRVRLQRRSLFSPLKKFEGWLHVASICLLFDL